MRTARALTVSPSMLCRGVCSGGVPGPRGVGVCTWSWGVCTWSGGCTWSPWGVPGPRGCTWSQGGVPGPGGVPGLRGVPGQVPPPVDRQMPVNLLPCPKLRLWVVNMYDLLGFTVAVVNPLLHGLQQPMLNWH